MYYRLRQISYSAHQCITDYDRLVIVLINVLQTTYSFAIVSSVSPPPADLVARAGAAAAECVWCERNSELVLS